MWRTAQDLQRYGEVGRVTFVTLFRIGLNNLRLMLWAWKNAVIQKGIEAMENFFRQIEMPTDLGGLNIEVSEDQMKELALKCSHFGKRTIGCVKKLNQEDIYRIYQKAAD